MRSLLLFVLLFGHSLVYSQTWSDDVATIFYNKCASCHHTGGIAPFSLMTFSEVSPNASFIYGAVNTESMPPWPPDNNFQTYAHDRSLTATEKTTVLNWINNGAPEGNAANTPPPPVFANGTLLGNGDLMVQMPTYMSKATAGNDDYACFVVPTNLPTDRTIRAIEIIPGNVEIVHHALIFIDPTGASVTDSIGGDCAGPSSPGAALVMGYTPGSTPLTLPAASPLKLGIPFPSNSQVLFNMHYPDGSYGEFDSTKVIFHFYPPGEPGIREVTTANVLENWSFSLPPNQVTSVSAQYPNSGGLQANFSLLSVFPHMHLLGKSMKVYAVDGSLDTLKLINVPDWDFHWQGFYFFKNIQKAAAGMTLRADAVFDNTTANPNNPNNPPAVVFPGLNTTDEMLLVYSHYMLYQPGDENYNLDSLMSLGFQELVNEEYGEGLFNAFPNPFDASINLYSTKVVPGDVVSVSIYDTQGKAIRQLMSGESVSGESLHLIWNGDNDGGEAVSSGMYFVSINVNGVLSNQRILKR